MNREQFLTVLDLARPALASKEFIPIFSHYCFDGKTVVAYNDLIAIKVPCKTPFKGALRGSKLLGLLKNSSGEKIEFEEIDEGLNIRVGGSDFDLPMLPEEDFIFEFPKAITNFTLDLNDEYMIAFDRALLGASNDTTRPQQMGITLKVSDDITVFSTDNVTITRQPVCEGPADTSLHDIMILPTEFCKSVRNISRVIDYEEDPSFSISDTHVIVEFGAECSVFSKLEIDVDPIDFPKVITSSLAGLDEDDFVPIPEQFPQAIQRSMVIMDSAIDSKCTMEIVDDRLMIHTESDYGKIEDSLKLKKTHPLVSAVVTPDLIHRVLNLCNEIAVLDRCVVMRGPKDFLHLIATKTQDE